MSTANTNAAEEWVLPLRASSATKDPNAPCEPDTVSNDGSANEERCLSSQFTGFHQTVADHSQTSVPVYIRRFSELDNRSTCLKGCIVVVFPLPNDITIRDVLARISGGALARATLAHFNNVKTAVITFKEAQSASKYSQICKKPSTSPWDLTASDTNKAPDDERVVMVVLPKLQHPVQHDPFESLLTPYLYSPFRQLPSTATRCIAIKNVPLNKLPQIWSLLGLANHLLVPHYRNQVEDIWLDRPTMQTVDDKRVVHMNMHIWFTSIGMAHTSRITQRYAGQFAQDENKFKPWDQNVSFEEDPCMAREKASDGSGLKFTWSSHGHTSLISLYDLGRLGKFFDMLQELPRTQEAVTQLGNTFTGPITSTNNNTTTTVHSTSRRLPSKAQLQVWQAPKNYWQNHLKRLAEEETASCSDVHCPGLEYARRAQNNGFTTLKNQDYALHFHHHLLDVKQPKCFLSTLDVFSSLVPSCSAYCPDSSGTVMEQNSLRTDYQLEVMTALAAKEKEEQQDAAVFEGTTPKQYPDYSRNNWEAGMRANKDKYAYHWTIGIEEYCSLTPEQLREFGGPGYIPPPGFTTIKKHLTQRSSA